MAHGPHVYVAFGTVCTQAIRDLLQIFFMTDIFLLIFFNTFFSDIDECSLKTDNCDSNAVCANTEGNFTCSCKTGFSGDGHFCAGLYCILGKIL